MLALGVPPRNDDILFTTIPYYSCHRKDVASGDTLVHKNPTVLTGCVDCIQWIAASVTSLPSRNDKEGELECFWVSLIRLQDEVDCRVGTGGAFSQ